MGQATIISHLGDGQYRVQPVFETARLQSMITQLSDEVARITTRLSELVGEINTADNDADYALQVLNAAITNGDPVEIKQATAAYRTAANLLGSLTQTQALLKLRKLAGDKRKSWLDGYNQPPPEVDIWCADLTEDLTGTVATAELGLQKIASIIRPGDNGAAVYDAARDGQHQPLAGSTPSAVFYNAAMRPGTEKWRPCYRTGSISALDTSANTASVNLDVATSDQGIDINQTASLTDIPVVYMTCNASAFTVGDHVLVEFVGRTWSAAQVVGFVDNPKSCAGDGWLCFPAGPAAGCELLTYAASWDQRSTALVAGAQHWRGNYVGGQPTKSLSWHGPECRYTYSASQYGQRVLGPLSTIKARSYTGARPSSIYDYLTAFIYQRGDLVATAPDLVTAAAVWADGRIVAATGSGTTTTFRLFDGSAWSTIGTLNTLGEMLPWKFSPDGLKVVGLDVSAYPSTIYHVTLTANSVSHTTEPGGVPASGAPGESSTGWAIQAVDFDTSGNYVNLKVTETTSFSWDEPVGTQVDGIRTITKTYTSPSLPTVSVTHQSRAVKFTYDDPPVVSIGSHLTWDLAHFSDFDLQHGAWVYGTSHFVGYDDITTMGSIQGFMCVIVNGQKTTTNGDLYQNASDHLSYPMIYLEPARSIVDIVSKVSSSAGIDARIIASPTAAVLALEGPLWEGEPGISSGPFFYGDSVPTGATLTQTETIQPLRAVGNV